MYGTLTWLCSVNMCRSKLLNNCDFTKKTTKEHLPTQSNFKKQRKQNSADNRFNDDCVHAVCIDLNPCNQTKLPVWVKKGILLLSTWLTELHDCSEY